MASSNIGNVCTAAVPFLLVHGLALITSMVVLLMGFRTSSHHIPDAGCTVSTQGGKEDRDEMNKANSIGGSMEVAVGVIAIVGVMLGIMGFCKKKHRCMQAAMIVTTTAAVFGGFSIVYQFFGFSHHGCGDYTCDGLLCSRSEEGGDSRRLADETGFVDAFVESGVSRCNSNYTITGHQSDTRCKFEYICKAQYDYFCESDKLGGIVGFFLSVIAIICTSVAGCYECSTPPPHGLAEAQLPVGQPAAESIGRQCRTAFP